MATWGLEESTTHLNHGSFGATPVEVLAYQQILRDQMESNPVTFMQRTYQPLLEISRAAVANFVGVDTDGLVFVPNATYGVNSVLRSLERRLGPDDEIIVTNHTYNACRNAAAETARRTGARLSVVDIPFPISEPSQVIDALENAVTEHTAVVLVDHVTSPTALVLPIREIVAALPEQVVVVVDGAHAPGMLDVAIEDLGVDFYTANCHKWMCSPKGAAFLWVREPWRSMTYPAAISHGYNGGWPTSSNKFHAQFDWTGTDDPTARLSIGEAISVMADHHQLGWAGIRQANHDLIVEGRGIVAQALGSVLPAPTSMLGSMAAVAIPAAHETSADALHEHWSIEVPVFSWPHEESQQLVRISAQVYNSTQDYERLAVALSRVPPQSS